MSDPPLDVCPNCKAPLRRVFTSSFVSTKPLGDRIPDSRLREFGFTKLQRGDDGNYHRVAGKEIPGA